MIEVSPGLFVGSGADFETIKDWDGWAFVHAAKEPWHRDALGYTTRGAPKDDPEYLWAVRDDRHLCMNLVDAADPSYISPELIEAALSFIGNSLTKGLTVLVHCNQGMSRAPTIALAWCAACHITPDKFEDAVEWFRGKYPDYLPNLGMRGFLEANWSSLRS